MHCLFLFKKREHYLKIQKRSTRRLRYSGASADVRGQHLSSAPILAWGPSDGTQLPVLHKVESSARGRGCVTLANAPRPNNKLFAVTVGVGASGHSAASPTHSARMSCVGAKRRALSAAQAAGTGAARRGVGYFGVGVVSGGAGQAAQRARRDRAACAQGGGGGGGECTRRAGMATRYAASDRGAASDELRSAVCMCAERGLHFGVVRRPDALRRSQIAERNIVYCSDDELVRAPRRCVPRRAGARRDAPCCRIAPFRAAAARHLRSARHRHPAPSGRLRGPSRGERGCAAHGRAPPARSLRLAWAAPRRVHVGRTECAPFMPRGAPLRARHPTVCAQQRRCPYFLLWRRLPTQNSRNAWAATFFFFLFFLSRLAAAVPLGSHRGGCGCARAMRAPLRPSPAGGPRERASRERWRSPLVRARARSGNRSMRKPHQSGPRAPPRRVPRKAPGCARARHWGTQEKHSKLPSKWPARANRANAIPGASDKSAPAHAPPPVACLAGARGRVSVVVVVARGGGRGEARARPCGYGWDGMGWAQRVCGC